MKFFDLHCDTAYKCFEDNICFNDSILAVTPKKAEIFDTWHQCFAIFIKDGISNPFEYYKNVFKGMQDMTELLNASVSAIDTMGDAHSKQAEVIKKTVSINQDIAESIRNENEQFSSINIMAEINANDTMEVATQASAINEMVDEISRLLAGQE